MFEEYLFNFDERLKRIDKLRCYVCGCSGPPSSECSCSGECDGSCYGEECASGCSSDCDGDCDGGCEDSCSSSCYGGCYTGCQGTCSGTCQGRCQGTCNGKCNTACTAVNTAELIANLGLSDVMYAHEVLAIKNAIENEFSRRGRSYSNPYSIPIAKGEKTLTEYGLKIMQDVYAFNNAKDWRSLIVKGDRAMKDTMMKAVDYIKTLMVQIV